MESRKMTNEEAQKWLNAMAALNKLNENVQATKKLAYGNQLAIEFYQSQTGNLPPSISGNPSLITEIQRQGKYLLDGMESLNSAFMLIKLNKAFVMPSEKYAGDFDIVTTKNMGKPEIEEAIFRRSMLGIAFLAPFVPLLIKAGTVVIVGALAYGCVDSVADATVKHAELDTRVVHMQSQLHRDMADDPDMYEKFTAWLKEKAKSSGENAKNWWQAVKDAAGGAAGLGIVLLIGLLVFRNMEKDK